MKPVKVLKKMFVWWRFEKEQKEAVEAAIIAIINKGKKVVVMVGELE